MPPRSRSTRWPRATDFLFYRVFRASRCSTCFENALVGEIRMTARVTRLALALLAPLMLVGCLLAPGKFTSTLTINADRTFTYSYQGEVYAFDLNEAMKDMPTGGDDDTKETDGVSLQKIGFDGNGQK